MDRERDQRHIDQIRKLLGALLSPSTGYTGGGIGLPQGVATDALGNVWTANFTATGSASKFSNGGTPISPDQGYSGGGIDRPVAVAVDSDGAVWLANGVGSPGNITKLSAAGQAMSPVNGLHGRWNQPGPSPSPSMAAALPGWPTTSATLSRRFPRQATPSRHPPASPAADSTGRSVSRSTAAGNIWVANSGIYSVTEISPSGAPMSPATGFTGGLMAEPEAVAIDRLRKCLDRQHPGHHRLPNSSARPLPSSPRLPLARRTARSELAPEPDLPVMCQRRRMHL